MTINCHKHSINHDNFNLQHGKSPLVRSMQVLELAGRYVKRKLKDRPLDKTNSRFDSYI